MGNKICTFKRNMVEERYTRPQRLVRQPSFVDYKKLRKLILSQKLAPCFDGVEDLEPNSDLEECPICFFFYPSLNRSRCCMKGICTECFLQMKPSSATQLTQCPFCKSSSYTVEYRGAKTKEEKGIEQAEEQKVIEAKMRMRFEESRSADQVRLANRNLSPVEIESPTQGSREVSNGFEDELIDSNVSSATGHVDATISSVLNAWNERQAEFGVDLEEIMIAEAILRSLQDTTSQSSTTQQSSGSYGNDESQFDDNLRNESIQPLSYESDSPDSVAVGIAAAIARLAERNILQSGTFSSIEDTDHQTSQAQDEIPLPEQAMGAVGSSGDPDFDDMGSKHEGLISTSTTDIDSVDSFSACILARNEDPRDEYNLDKDPILEPSDNSCSGSVHAIADAGSGSPTCPELLVRSRT